MNNLITAATIVLVIVALAVPTTAVPVANVNASALGMSDFDSNPEGVCVTLGDKPGMKPVCDWIDVCDDEGSVRPDDQFCTGEAVRNIPYPPGGCLEGYHSNEDDETGLCYDNDLGCQHDYLIFNNDKTSCIEYKVQCEYNRDHPLCNGVERTDGIKVCDQPDHPGYKFCNDETD